jgi:hypothetical protein
MQRPQRNLVKGTLAGPDPLSGRKAINAPTINNIIYLVGFVVVIGAITSLRVRT